MARTVCGQFCGIFGGFFAVVGPLLHERCLSQVVPLCLVVRNCTAEGYEPVCALLKCAFLRFFPQFLSFFPRRFEHGHFSCKGGRDMTGKIPTTFATSCNRPSALWASQPSLYLFFSPFHLPPPIHLPFLFFSPIFLLFHPFPSSLPFSCPLFSHNFPAFFPSSPLTSRFFQHFLVKPTCLSVTSVPTLCPARHLEQANATCCECAFLLISRHFRAHPKNEGPYLEENQKRKVFSVHVIRTLSFFSGKKVMFLK